MLNSEIIPLYGQFRKHSPFMLQGYNAQRALSSARTLLEFRELENAGQVRILAEFEDENYFSVFGEPDTEKEKQQIIDTIEKYGCFCVKTEFFDGEAWIISNSIGFFIYDDPTDPFENCYVIDLMQSALDQLSEFKAQYPAELITV